MSTTTKGPVSRSAEAQGLAEPHVRVSAANAAPLVLAAGLLRIQVKVVHCARCAAGELQASVLTGQGKQLKVTPLTVQPLEKGVAPRMLARG